MRARLTLLVFLIFLGIGQALAHRIALFVPHTEKFWGSFSELAKAAANDLGAQLDIHVSSGSPQRMLEQVRSVTENGVDGILFFDYQGIGETILQQTEATHTPAMLVNAGLLNEKLVPRNDYRSWIGSVTPNDREAGIRLTTHLIEAARRKGIDQFNILAFTGNTELPMLRRLEGLSSVIGARDDVHLLRTVGFNDGDERIIQAFDDALQKYPEINVIWTFSDDLALLLARHHQHLGGKRPMVFGGINWTSAAMSAVREGLIDVDMGGHLFDGAQAVILLNDYLNGHDFGDQAISWQSAMVAATPRDVDRYEYMLSLPERIDYRALSRTYTPSLKQLRFDLDAIAASVRHEVDLSPAEQQWIAQHPVIRTGGTAQWPPFEFESEKHEYEGIANDYLQLIGKRTGLKFDVTTSDWGEALAAFRRGDVDLLPAAYFTADRTRFANYSPAYFDTSNQFFVRDNLDIKTIDDLKHHRVAIPKSYAQAKFLRAQYPDMPIVEVENLAEAVDHVLAGKADALFDTYAVLSHMLRERGIYSIVPFNGAPGVETHSLHMMVSKRQPVLTHIIEKAINSIGAEERNRIRSRWLDRRPTADDAGALSLSRSEQQWLDAHPHIRLEFGSFPPWEIIGKDGTPQGITIDVLRLIEQRLGIRFDIKDEMDWPTTEAALKSREVDVAGTLALTPSRTQFLDYTRPYSTFQYSIYTRLNSRSVESLNDLNGRTVAVEEGFNTYEELSRRYPAIKFVFAPDTGRALEMLSTGKVDAYVGNQGIANWEIERLKLTNLHVAYLASELGPTPLHFGIRSDWPQLRELMDKAIDSISDTEMLDIRRRWLGISSQPAFLALSAQERAWLRAHPIIRFTGDPNWLPYEAKDANGKYIGIVADHLALLEQQLGIDFQYIPTDTWTESLNLVNDHQVDMISETLDSDLARTLKFTRPYLSSPVVIVMRDNQTYVDDVHTLGQRPVAVIRNYGYLTSVFAKYPDLNYLTVDSIQEGLQAVATGKAGAMFATLAQASYHMGEQGMNNLRIVGTTGVDVELGFGIQPDMAPLVPLINRAMATIAPAEKRRILDAWGKERFTSRVDYSQIAAVVAVASAMLTLALLWIVGMRRQQRKLRHSEERFALAMEAAQAGFWDYRIDTGEVYFSALWMQMLGYAPGELPARISTFTELIHPDDTDRIKTAHDALLRIPSTPIDAEFRMRTKEGAYRWVHSRGQIFLTDRDGNPLRAIGTHLDVTDRKAAEEHLHIFRQFADTANIGFGMASMDQRIEYMNTALRRMLGVGDDACVGENFERFYTPESKRRIHNELLPVLKQDGTWVGEMEMVSADGSAIPTLESFFVVRDNDGRPLRLGDVITDLSERRAAEAQFSRLIHALPVAIIIADLDGTIVLANPQAEQEAGRPDSLVGMNTADIYAEPDMRERVLEGIRARGSIDVMEVAYRTGDGSILSGLLSALPIQFNRAPAILGVIVNITERRRMERDLQQAKDEAEAANRFKGQFLANMSHEIRTPMNAIVGLGHLLNRTELTPQQQDYLGKVQVSARTLLTLIDDILDLSKIEAGQLRIETIDFDLGEVLDNVATMASTRLADKPVEFVYDIDPTVPSALRGDPHRLAQILTNLVGNATKFTERGSIVVRLHMLEETTPMRVRISVEDTGIGIAPDQQAHLFSPFKQADGSTTRLYGGTGLGLSICRQLCDLMGGSIQVDSTPGEGSRFSVELPFEVSTTSYPGRNGLDTAHLRVLLVDDNAITRQVLADMLQSLAFNVEVVAGGDAALRRLEEAKRPFDLMLLDWRMPGMDGVETARRIRDTFGDASPRIILMTAYGREAPADGPDMPHLDGFLTKPITPSHLLDAVATALGPSHEHALQSAQHKERMEQRQLSGKVLLVEDNPINQQVARELLEQMGLDVSIANNGRQSLEMVGIVHPDLVLMDIQMPDIDGYQATESIRTLPGMSELPIIAMTANAMAGDAERSLEAGMNGHITKPVDPIRLFDTLLAWLPEAPMSERNGIPNHHDTDALPSLHHLDAADGIRRVGGNRVLYARLCGDFAQRYERTIDELEQWCRQSDAQALAHALHSLKGVAGNIGAQRTHHHAATLERLAREGDIAGVHEGLTALAEALHASLADAHRVAGTSVPPPAQGRGERDGEDVASGLERLAALIQTGDADAIDLVQALDATGLSDQARQLFLRLQSDITDYDFSNAEIHVNALQHLLSTETPAS